MKDNKRNYKSAPLTVDPVLAPRCKIHNNRMIPFDKYVYVYIYINIFRQPQHRSQAQQPLKFEMLPQQQQLKQQSQKSPKRDNRTLLSQSIIHQSYGVSEGGGGMVAGNISRQRNVISTGEMANCGNSNLPPHLSMAYYAQQPPSQSYFGEVLHPMQVWINNNKLYISTPCLENVWKILTPVQIIYYIYTIYNTFNVSEVI